MPEWLDHAPSTGPSLPHVLQGRRLVEHLQRSLVGLHPDTLDAAQQINVKSMVSACVAQATRRAALGTEENAHLVTDALTNAKNALLVALYECMSEASPTAAWTNDDLKSNVLHTIKNAWDTMPLHLASRGAHAMLDSGMLSATDKLYACFFLRPWAWPKYGLPPKIAPLLPTDPYERAMMLPWGGRQDPKDLSQAMMGVRINKSMAQTYVPELYGMMQLADSTVGAWRTKTHVLGLLRHFRPKTEPVQELALPDGMEFEP